MLQTKSKEKLPKGHTYPVGAEALSAALDGIPQFSLITLSFWYKDEFFSSSYDQKLREGGVIAVLRAEYGAPFYDWRIHICSVPSAVKAQVAAAISNRVIPALKASYQSLSTVTAGAAKHQSFKATISLSDGHVQIFS